MYKKLSNFFIKSFNIVGIPFLIALLGGCGGQGIKGLRRFGIPCVVTIYAYFLLQNWWVLTILSMIGVFSIGYGRDDGFDDKPSFLGKIAKKIFPTNAMLQDVMIRGTVGFLMCLSLLSIPIIKGTWVGYSLGSVGILLSWGLLSWQGFGVVKFNWFGKNMEVCKVDLLHYSFIGSVIIFIIQNNIKF
jgi:hypothetical protein